MYQNFLKGKLATYSQIAQFVGRENNARLIGSIISNASLYENHPCHRVVNSKEKLVADWLAQLALLKEEGIFLEEWLLDYDTIKRKEGYVMKLKNILLSISLILTLTACSNSNENEEKDFWEATVDVLEDKLEGNQYNEGNWQIGVEDLSRVEDESHRSLTIRYINESELTTETTMFSLQNKDGKKEISYIYKISEVRDYNQYDQSLTLRSTDEDYKQYQINYTYQEFRYENYFDGNEVEAILTINEDNTITYDNVPLLNETMTHCLDLLERFQKEFSINYHDYDFISLPELCKDLEIPSMNSIDENVSTTLNFYSEVRYNARGHSLIDCLQIDKDYAIATLRVYNVGRRSYDSTIENTLEKRGIDNCYNMVTQYDLEASYAVYLQEEIAYLYPQSVSDQEIENDVINNGGSQASIILKTTNDSYQDVIMN